MSQNVDLPPVLIAAPTYAGKGYCLDQYIDAVKAIEYPDAHLLLIDNTKDTLDYYERIKALDVNVEHMDPHDNFGHTNFCAFRQIGEYARAQNFPMILSLEQDVIIPPHALTAMVEKMLAQDLCVLYHHYPPREGTGWTVSMAELGCTLVRSDDWQAAIQYVLAQPEGCSFPDALQQVSHRHAFAKDLFEAQHLAGPGDDWPFEDKDIRLFNGDDEHAALYVAWSRPRSEEEATAGQPDAPGIDSETARA